MSNPNVFSVQPKLKKKIVLAVPTVLEGTVSSKWTVHNMLQWLELTICSFPQADISRANLIDEIRRRTSEA